MTRLSDFVLIYFKFPCTQEYMDPELRVYINMQSCPLPLYTKVNTYTLIILPIFNIVLIGNGTIINVALLTWHDEAISNVQYTRYTFSVKSQRVAFVFFFWVSDHLIERFL